MILSVAIWFMGLIVFMFGLCLICNVSKSKGSSADYTPTGFAYVVLGAILLVMTTFLIIPGEFPTGLPSESIDTGEYKIAFVYVAGENVNIGIEQKYGETERLYLYQFPKSAFDSNSINTKARELVVVESEEFRKLVLR